MINAGDSKKKYIHSSSANGFWSHYGERPLLRVTNKIETATRVSNWHITIDL